MWTVAINKVIDYIEDNIDNEINNDVIATIACSSIYNFQRIFSFVFNITLAEYIRYRRLSLAAVELIHSDLKIIDIALKHGYETHESFSRAFYQFHGVLPSEAKNKDYGLKYCSRATLETNIKASIEIVKLKEISLGYILNNLKTKSTNYIKLSELTHNGNAENVNIGSDYISATCDDDIFQMSTCNEYQIPLRIDIIAKTDSTNLKLLYGKGDLTLNWKYSDWDYKNNELMIHDVITGYCFGYPNKGLISCNTFINISWIITKEFMALIIDNELHYYNENLPYTKEFLKNTNLIFTSKIGVAPAWGSKITISEFSVIELI